MYKRLSAGLLSLLLILTMAIGLTGCGSGKEQPAKTNQTQNNSFSTTDKTSAESNNTVDENSNTSKTFTLDELAKYDGKNGNPAYAAVDGFVYDVSNDRAWRDGQHEAYRAGTDLTEDMANSPHGLGVLKGLPVVGKLAK